MEVIGLLRELHGKQEHGTRTLTDTCTQVTPVNAFQEVNCVIHWGIRTQLRD